VAAALGNALVFGLQSTVLHSVTSLRACEPFDYGTINGWLLGLASGTAAGLAELPNSFLKRQMGVPAGGSRRGAWGVLLYVVDQVDVLIGLWLVCGWFLRPTVARVSASVVILFIAHQIVTLAGCALGMRRTLT
jgi:hypothetical protein